MSPASAAACALTGKLADVRKHAGSSQGKASAPSVPVQSEEAHVSDIESDVDLDKILDDPEDSQGNAVQTGAPSVGGMPPLTQWQRGPRLRSKQRALPQSEDHSLNRCQFRLRQQ